MWSSAPRLFVSPDWPFGLPAHSPSCPYPRMAWSALARGRWAAKVIFLALFDRGLRLLDAEGFDGDSGAWGTTLAADCDGRRV